MNWPQTANCLVRESKGKRKKKRQVTSRAHKQCIKTSEGGKCVSVLSMISIDRLWELGQ